MTGKEFILAVNLLGPLIALFYCVWMLVRYRLKRRFKKDSPKGRLQWLQENTVEIFIFLMFVAIAAPDWGSLIASALPGG